MEVLNVHISVMLLPNTFLKTLVSACKIILLRLLRYHVYLPEKKIRNYYVVMLGLYVREAEQVVFSLTCLSHGLMRIRS